MSSPLPSDATTLQLVHRLNSQIRCLIRDEIALAKLELAAKGKRLGLGAGLLAVAGLLSVYGLGAGLVAAGLALALVLDGWLAALTLTGGIVVLVALLALVGLRSVKRGVPPMPEKAADGFKKDVATLRGKS